MPEISIQLTKQDNHGYKFKVGVEEESSTRHLVTMGRSFYDSLETHASPDEIIRKSFEFLLEREPKEAVLPEFDVTTISNYFPEYAEFIRAVCGKSSND